MVTTHTSFRAISTTLMWLGELCCQPTGRFCAWLGGMSDAPDQGTVVRTDAARTTVLTFGIDFCVRLLFVSVDPNRDTLEVLNRYVHAFSPQFDGLRGSDEQLADVARRYRVAYSVDPKPPYTVMHSNAVFFFDPTGRIRLVTTDTTDTDAIAEDVRRLSDM